MSIKIIKNTMTDPITRTCPTCESIFSYTFEDIRRNEDQWLFGLHIRRFIVCPVCKRDIDLGATVEPSRRSEEDIRTCDYCKHNAGLPSNNGTLEYTGACKNCVAKDMWEAENEKKE